MPNKRLDYPGLKGSLIQTKQFKTVQLQLRFFTAIDKSQITKRSLLASMMRVQTQRYPSRLAMGQAQDDLYSVSLNTQVSLLGAKHVMTVSLRFAHPRFIGSSYAEELLAFLNEVLWAPSFTQKSLDEEKAFLKDYIESIITQKGRYAYKRFSEELLGDQPYYCDAYGSLDDLESISLSDIENAYDAMMHSDAVYLSLIGDVDGWFDENRILKALNLKPRSASFDRLIIHPIVSPKAPVYDVQDVMQERLYLAYSLPVYADDAHYYVALVLNQILGEDSDSLLFKTVRETHGLAYSVGSSFISSWGLLIISLGISYDNTTQALQLIDSCLKVLQNGDFETTQLAMAKQNLKNSIWMASDSASVVAQRALREHLMGLNADIESTFKAIDAVQHDDVVSLAQSLSNIFHYTLGGHKDEKTHL